MVRERGSNLYLTLKNESWHLDTPPPGLLVLFIHSLFFRWTVMASDIRLTSGVRRTDKSLNKWLCTNCFVTPDEDFWSRVTEYCSRNSHQHIILTLLGLQTHTSFSGKPFFGFSFFQLICHFFGCRLFVRFVHNSLNTEKTFKHFLMWGNQSDYFYVTIVAKWIL